MRKPIAALDSDKVIHNVTIECIMPFAFSSSQYLTGTAID